MAGRGWRKVWVTDWRFSRQELRLETGDWRLESSAQSRSVGNDGRGAPPALGFCFLSGPNPRRVDLSIDSLVLGLGARVSEGVCWSEWAGKLGGWDSFFVCGSGDGERGSLIGALWAKGNSGGGPAGTVPGSGGGMGRCLEPTARRGGASRDEESENPQAGSRRGGSFPARA